MSDRCANVDGAGAGPGRSRVGTVRALPRVLRELGIDPVAACRGAGIEASLFDQPDHTISDAALGRLLHEASERSGCHDLGLRLARGAGLSSLGLVGQLAAHAPDVGSALGQLRAHLGLQDGAALLSLSVTGPLLIVTYALYEPVLEGSDQRLQHALAVMHNVMRELAGPGWAPVEVWLPCRRPADTRNLERFFRAPLRFDADRAALLFARGWLARPLREADAGAHDDLLRIVEIVGAEREDPLPVRVRRRVRELLLASRGSLEDVARDFSVHRRTLDRWLDASGASFRELADDVRFAVARQLLRDTDLPVTRIAAALHYGDVSAFDHAFRRWSGTTPTEWRRRLDAGRYASAAIWGPMRSASGASRATSNP